MTEEPRSLTKSIEPTSSMAVAPKSRRLRAEPEDLATRSATRAAPSLELHVEELVLDGFEPAQRYALGEAFERELGRLFAERGVPATLIEDLEIAHLDGGAINLRPGSSAADAGIELAGRIYGGLDK